MESLQHTYTHSYTHVPFIKETLLTRVFPLHSNKAQLRELEHIRTNLLGSRKALALSPASSPPPPGRPTLKTVLTAARFVARLRLSARAWARQEVVRTRLTAANEEQKRVRRARKLKVVRTEEVL